MNQVVIDSRQLTVISIHRSKYWLFKSPILAFLHQQTNTTVRPPHRKHGSISSISSFEFDNKIDSGESTPEPDYSFFHIAFTPTECTVILPTSMLPLFKEPLEVSEKMQYDVQVFPNTYVSLQIDSGGDNSRILQLTKPLSDNGISLLFLSSHFSDIVLIPHGLESKVVSILTQNNFQFNDLSGSYVVDQETVSYGDKKLEERVFKLFKSYNINPFVDRRVSLLLTGSRSNEVDNSILKVAKSISADIIPDYFAVTKTSSNEVSLMLPKDSEKRARLGFPSKVLVGSTLDEVNPVMIDLTKLPVNSTGIVAGLSSKIIGGVGRIELNYLSMARSAILMVPTEDVDDVTKTLLDAWGLYTWDSRRQLNRIGRGI